VQRTELTTGEIADVFGICKQHAQRLIDTGELRGYRIPGSEERRASISECYKLAKESNHDTAMARLHKLAIDARVVLPAAAWIMICSPDKFLPPYFATAGYQVVTATNWFYAGVFITQHTYDAFILDCLLGSDSVVSYAKYIAESFDGNVICAIAMEDNVVESEHFACVWRRPCDWQYGVKQLHQMLHQKNGIKR